MPRKPREQPEFKVCTVCKVEKHKFCFRLEPYGNNPEYRRNQCDDCRNRYTRERLKRQDKHKERYRSMSEEERACYIKYKSEMNQIRFKTDPEALAKKKFYDKTDRAIFNRYKNEVKRRTRLLRGIKFELEFEYFSTLINSTCTYCGKENCRGVDRIDSDKSYTIENSTPCCFLCNGMKRAMSVDDFKEHINKIARHINKIARHINKENK